VCGPVKDPGDEDEVGRTAYRQEFRNSLNGAENYRLNNGH
jgi:hypothetical protein